MEKQTFNNKKNAHQRGGLVTRFAVVSANHDPYTIAVVKHLARIAADKDYKKVLEMSNPDYNESDAKGNRYE